MNNEHPITPPPELVQEWSCDCPLTDPFNRELYVATIAARWGADQELEACVEWASCFNYDDYRYDEVLRDIRRSPEPPSLKEQALEAVDALEGFKGVGIIRRALESLPD